MTEDVGIRIARVAEREARVRSDSVVVLEELLHAHETYYPGIRKWLEGKVLPGLRTGERVGYIGLNGERPILAAIVKRGALTKFCHVSVADEYRETRLGQLLFAMMAAEARHAAKEVHFTLPESLWEHKRLFFEGFGFEAATVASRQYRLFDRELRCSAPFTTVWSRIAEMLPTLVTDQLVAGYRINDGVVLAIKEPFASAVMSGEKRVEVRRRFSNRWSGRSASVYAAGGSGSLLGTVVIGRVIRADPREIWSQYGRDLWCTREDFDSYVGDRTEVFAIELEDPRPYRSPVSLSQLSHLTGEMLRPPQSYAAHSLGDGWGRALSVAALLHGVSPATSAPARIRNTRGRSSADNFDVADNSQLNLL